MAAYAWIGQIFNFLAGAVYQTAPTPLTAGSGGPLLCDQYARLIVVTNPAGGPVLTGAATWVDPSASVASGVIKNAPATLLQFFGQSNYTSTRWIMVFNSTTVPSNGATPLLSVSVPATGVFTFDLPRGKPFSTGISWAASSTRDTLTIDSSALIWANAEISF